MTSLRSPRTRSLRLALIAASVLAGAPAAAESLADAVAAAYARNPVLTRDRFRQQALDENYVQARSGYGPRVTVEANTAYSRLESTTVNPITGARTDNVINSDSGLAQVTINQPLYTSGRLRGQVASARASVLAGQETLRQTEGEVVASVVNIYSAVLRDQARLEVSRENVAVLREQLDEKVERRRRDDVTLTDVGQSDARLAAAEIQLAQAESQLAVSRGQYLQLIGRNPGTLEPLPELAGLPASLDEAFAAAEGENAEIAAAKRTEEASSANAAAVRGERGLSIGLTGRAGYQNDAFRFEGDRGRTSFTGGLTASVPLFAAGALSSRVRQADARNSADQATIDITRRQIMQDVVSAWNQLAAARTGLVSGQRQVESAQLAFAGMRRESLEGLRSTIDTLNAEQELQSAQLNFLQNRFLEYTARANLLLAMGRLRAASVTAIPDPYDPEVHFRKVRNRGMTPFEPIAMGLDRIGSPAIRRPLSANLTGAGTPKPDEARALPPTPGPDLTRAPLTPITKSRLVPARDLPGGLPRTGETLPTPPPEADPK